MIIFYTWVAVLIAAAWLYLRSLYSSFSKYGVKHLKPVPLIGNMTKILLRYDHFVDLVQELYDSFPEERFVGSYQFTKELVMIRDIELIKKVTVKDFDHFVDHRTFFEGGGDSSFNRNLIALKGQEWRDMRSTLSPAFTSSKIRLMVPFMVEVGDQMVAVLKKNMKENGNYLDVECKDLTTRYANDVIASCAFGLKVDSHTEDNEFYVMGKTLSTFDYRQMLKMFLIMCAPQVTRLLKIDFLKTDTKNFFDHLVLDTMKDREAHNIIRPDMIHLLMEARKGKLTHEEIKPGDVAAGFATVDESAVGTKAVNRAWTDKDLIAQAVLFLLAGFETVSTAMSFLLHELALNPEVQEKLAQEIKEENEKNNGKFDFNSIQKMTYMDMVISELLRLWPPAIGLDRVCVKDYNLGKPNDKADKDFIIRKGSGVSIPTWSIHRDPQFFPNPDKFDPERFSEENKHNINSTAYMPFGVGPRNCIGSRFALCEMKVMTYQVLQHFVLSPCERTCIPVELCKKTFGMRIKGGHWLRFKVRE